MAGKSIPPYVLGTCIVFCPGVCRLCWHGGLQQSGNFGTFSRKKTNKTTLVNIRSGRRFAPLHCVYWTVPCPLRRDDLWRDYANSDDLGRMREITV